MNDYNQGFEDFQSGLRPQSTALNYLTGWMEAEYDAKHDSQGNLIEASDENKTV